MYLATYRLAGRHSAAGSRRPCSRHTAPSRPPARAPRCWPPSPGRGWRAATCGCSTCHPHRCRSAGPGLDYLLDTLPLGEALVLALSGSGECAEVAWSLFSISIPGWTLIGFGLLAAGCAVLLAGLLQRMRAH